MSQIRIGLVWCLSLLIISGYTGCTHKIILFSDSANVAIVDSELAIRLDSFLINEVKNGFTGSVLVAKKGKIILQNGYGWTDSTRSVPVTPQTGFYIASVTKGFTGMAAVIAEAKGFLSLHKPIGGYLENVPDSFDSVSIHRMLTHTSGLSGGYNSFGFVDRKDNVTQILGDSLDEIGKFNYTGAGYWLTAALIEIAVQMPYDQFIKTEIFLSAGMVSTHFWFEIDDNDNSRYAQKLSPFPPSGKSPNWGFRGSGGLISTAPDLYRYFLLFSGNSEFSSLSREKMVGPHLTLGSSIGIGYGWFITTTERGTQEIWSRGGESFGHNSALRWFIDEDVIIIVLTASGRMEGEDMEANRVISNKLEREIFKDDNLD